MRTAKRLNMIKDPDILSLLQLRRWDKRDYQDIQNRWNARKQRRALHAAIENTNLSGEGKRL